MKIPFCAGVYTMSNDLMDMLKYEDPVQGHLCAGNEAAFSSYGENPSASFMTRFKNFFGHLHDNLFGLVNTETLAKEMGEIKNIDFKSMENKHRQAVQIANKIGYVDIGKINVPRVHGLKGQMVDYGKLLMDYADMGTLIEKMLDNVYRTLSLFINDPSMIRSVTSTQTLNIDTLERHRAKYHSLIRSLIEEDEAGNVILFNKTYKSNAALAQSFGYVPKLKGTVDLKQMNAIADKIKLIRHQMVLLVESTETVGSSQKPNMKVLHAISDLLYNSGLAVQDYGTYIHRVNNYVGVCNSIAEEVIRAKK